MVVCVCVFKSNSTFLERQVEMNKQKTSKKPPGNIVQNGGLSKLKPPLCQGYALQILKQSAAKPFNQRIICK